MLKANEVGSQKYVIDPSGSIIKCRAGIALKAGWRDAVQDDLLAAEDLEFARAAREEIEAAEALAAAQAANP